MSEYPIIQTLLPYNSRFHEDNLERSSSDPKEASGEEYPKR